MIWLAETRDNAQTVFRIGRDGERLVAEWIGLGTFSATRDGKAPRFDIHPGVDAALVEKLERGPIRALVRHLRGELSFHASAVAIRDGAIALVGDSGAGKSTLAFALASSSEHAFTMLSDDCLCVDDDCAQPTESIGWLDAAARTALRLPHGDGKSPAKPARIATTGSPLRKIVRLAFGAEIRVTRLKGTETAAVLGQAMIRFVVDEPDVHRADMDRLASMLSRVSVMELTRPRGFEYLDATIHQMNELCDW